MKDVVIIPTYNERENIAPLIRQLTARYPDLYIVVVDDNSPDGTGAVVATLVAQYPHLSLRQRAGKLGLASAYLETIRDLLAKETHIRSIITMDADFSHDPQVIGEMRARLDQYDLIIGSRYIPGGTLVNWPRMRQLISILGNWYAGMTSGTGIHDLTAGFQCFRADLLRQDAFSRVGATGFAFQMEMKIVAYFLNARIIEIPITFTNRTTGESKLTTQLTSYLYEGLIMPVRLRLQHQDLIGRRARVRK